MKPIKSAKLLYLVSIVLSGLNCYLGVPFQGRTTAPASSDTEENEPMEVEMFDTVEEMETGIRPILDCALNRDEAMRTLQRAMDILRHQPGLSRGRNYTEEAKVLLRGLTCDPNIGSTSADSSQSSGAASNHSEFCEINLPDGSKRRIMDSTKRDILRLHDEKKMSEKAIRAQYPWFHMQYIERFRASCNPDGGSQTHRINQINQFVLERAEEVMAAQQPLHDYMLVRWAVQRAGELNARSFFTASHTWLLRFKKRADVVSRKITSYITRSSTENQGETEASIERFRERYLRSAFRVPPRVIYNVDQTGFNYAVYRDRTLAKKGSRDVNIVVDNSGKRTHSYTAQPMISRDGRLFGKLLLCLKERDGAFGPNVANRVRQLENEYGKVEVVSSKSGKMTSELTSAWIRKVLVPACRDRLHEDMRTGEVGVSPNLFDAEDQQEFVDIDEESDSDERRCYFRYFDEAFTICDRNTSMNRTDCEIALSLHARNRCRTWFHSVLLVDSWGGHTNRRILDELRANGVQPIVIPARTTGQIQPLDVTFMRQYKIFVKRILEEAIHTGSIDDVTSRDGIINMHSLVWNQFNSISYTDMLRFALRHTDPAFTRDEIASRAVPPMVLDIQFKFDQSRRCEVHNCTEYAFIKCSHCGKHLCLKHFLERKCFQTENANEPRPGTSSESNIVGPSYRRIIPGYDDWEETFHENLRNFGEYYHYNVSGAEVGGSSSGSESGVTPASPSEQYRPRDELRA